MASIRSLWVVFLLCLMRHGWGEDVVSSMPDRAEIQAVAEQLESIRGLAFKAEVKVELQSMENFQKFIASEIDKELPLDKAEKTAQMLYAFGLVPRNYDIRKGICDLLVSQAGAYYRADTGTFYVLSLLESSNEMNLLVSHELQHALQDQHFGLVAIQKKMLEEKNEDKRSVQTYVLEGEATYVMFRYQLQSSNSKRATKSSEKMDTLANSFRHLQRKTLLLAMRVGAPKGKDGALIRKSITGLKQVPPVLFWNLFDPYFKGQYAIHFLYSKGGWESVASLYTEPPTSTEQMLHPEKLLAPRDEPSEVSAPNLLEKLDDAWSEIYSNTMGEAGMLAFFDTHLPKSKELAASGWDGDRYQVIRHSDGRMVLGWWSVWDTDQDAREFVEAMGAIKPKHLGASNKMGTVHISQDGTRVEVMVGPKSILNP